MLTATFEERRDDLISSVNDVTDSVTGYSLNVSKNDPSDILSVILNDVAQIQSDLISKLVFLRTSFNPYKATGALLRDVISYRNITAKTGTATTATVTFAGGATTVIAEGTQVATASGDKIFVTLAEATIPAEGTITAGVACTEVGNISLDVGELKTIVKSDLYDVSVTANTVGIVGENAESDSDIHKRLEVFDSDNSNFLNSMRAQILNVSGVTSCSIYIGDDSGKDLDYAQICCVVGGTASDDDIATAIFENNHFFYKTTGDTVCTVESDVLGKEYEVKFKKLAQTQSVDLTIKYEKNNESFNEEDVKTAFKTYINTYVQSVQPNSRLYLVNLASDLQSLNLCKVASVLSASKEYIDVDWSQLLLINEITMEELE